MKADFGVDPDRSLGSVGDRVRGCCDGWAERNEGPLMVTRVVIVVAVELLVFSH